MPIRNANSGPFVIASDLAAPPAQPALLGTSNGRTFEYRPIDAAGGVASVNSLDALGSRVDAVIGGAIQSTHLEPATGVHSIVTEQGASSVLPVVLPPDSVALVEVQPVFSADSQKVWTSVLRGTAFRVGNAAPTVVQSLDAGGVLTVPEWNPELVVVGNSIELQVTADLDDVVVPRGRVNVSIVSTSDDPPTPVHTTAWLRARVELIANAANVLSQFTDPVLQGGECIEWPGTNGHVALPSGGVLFDVGTIGSGGRLALVGKSVGVAPSSLTVELGTAIQTIIAVTAFPVTPAETFRVLVQTGSSNDAAMIPTGASALIARAGWTPTIDNVATSNIGPAGGVHLIIWENPTNVETVLNIGWPEQLNPYAWNVPLAYVGAFGTTFNAEQKTALYDLMVAAGNGFYV